MNKKGLVQELHKPARKHYPRRHVTIKGMHDLWQADLVEMLPYARINKGFKYILTCIDTFSKFGYVEPLKSKKGSEVCDAFQRILDKSNVSPKNLQTDMGKEFYNAKFSQLMKKFEINHYSTYSPMKASICERWNRTLKNRMWLEFSLRGTYKWIDFIQSLVHKYNHTKHRTIKLQPAEVTKDNESLLLNTVYATPRDQIIPLSKLNVGDHVRISKQKCIFQKGYHPNWTTEVFKIRLVQPTHPPTYLLEDLDENPINGSFYKEELQKTRYPDTYLVEKVLKKEKGKVLVKWLGFTKPTWIMESDILFH